MTKSEIIALITPTITQAASDALTDSKQYTDAEILSLSGQVANDIADAIIQSESYTDNKFLQVSSSSLQGVAQPSDNPGANVQGRWWLTSEAGVYTNFGGITVGAAELVAIVDDGVNYTKVEIPIDLSTYVSYGDLETNSLVKESDFIIGKGVTSTTGAEYSDSDRVTTDFIDVGGGSTLPSVIITKTVNAGTYIVCYDNSYNYIGRIEPIYNPDIGAYQLTPLTNTRYIRQSTVSTNPATRSDDIAGFGIFPSGIYKKGINKIQGATIVPDGIEDMVSSKKTTLYGARLDKAADILLNRRINSETGQIISNSDFVATEAIDVTGYNQVFLTKSMNAHSTVVCYSSSSATDYIGRVPLEDMNDGFFKAVLLYGTTHIRYTLSTSLASRASDIEAFGVYRSLTLDEYVQEFNKNPLLPTLYFEPRTVFPTLEWGGMTTTGEFSTQPVVKRYIRTPKLIKVKGNKYIDISSSAQCEYRISYFDKDGALTRNEDWFNSSSYGRIGIKEDEWFIKITTRKNSLLQDQEMLTISLTGHFEKDFECFNAYKDIQRIAVVVNCADVTSANGTTDNVQDVEDLKIDYGLLALPTTYSKDGEPTRLIIYCHGAGVNYADNVTEFPATDIQPEYWLKQGYAVMDIEGNPFNNTDEHGYTPQAIQCYIAAYEWVIKNYNIKRDGIFLGGRSMGGGMCFEILQSRIPVIAACPLVPVANTLLWWNYCNAARRSFMAQHMGFEGTVTWTNSNPMNTSEWGHLENNFERMVRYSPFWRCIENLPDKGTLFANARIASSTTEDANETALYSTLRAKLKAPVKMFAVKDDATIPYKRNALLMHKMLTNAGQICELRLFEVGGHHFEIDNPNCLTTTTTKYGEVLNNIPVVYIEMLQFWRRYEVS